MCVTIFTPYLLYVTIICHMYGSVQIELSMMLATYQYEPKVFKNKTEKRNKTRANTPSKGTHRLFWFPTRRGARSASPCVQATATVMTLVPSSPNKPRGHTAKETHAQLIWAFQNCSFSALHVPCGTSEE